MPISKKCNLKNGDIMELFNTDEYFQSWHTRSDILKYIKSYFIRTRGIEFLAPEDKEKSGVPIWSHRIGGALKHAKDIKLFDHDEKNKSYRRLDIDEKVQSVSIKNKPSDNAKSINYETLSKRLDLLKALYKAKRITKREFEKKKAQLIDLI